MQNNTYGGEKGRYNVVNNYYKAGPAVHKHRKDRIVNPSRPYGKFYVSGNVLVDNSEITADNSKGVVADSIGSILMDTPFDVEDVQTQQASVAYESVLERAGASLARDKVDSRIVAEVRSGNSAMGGNKNGIIDSQKDVGGWPTLKSFAPESDADRDGMPDEWERLKKLDPNDPSDANRFTLSKGYTNIEVYINTLAEKVK